MIITVKVIPKASRDEVIKISDDEFRVKTVVAPERGKANKRVIELLSQYFQQPKSSFNILRGDTSQFKVIEVENLT